MGSDSLWALQGSAEAGFSESIIRGFLKWRISFHRADFKPVVLPDTGYLAFDVPQD